MYRLPFQGDDITSTTASTPHTLGSIDEGVELALEEAAVAFNRQFWPDNCLRLDAFWTAIARTAGITRSITQWPTHDGFLLYSDREVSVRVGAIKSAADARYLLPRRHGHQPLPLDSHGRHALCRIQLALFGSLYSACPVSSPRHPELEG